jgi:outer membrane receptor for ferrienterochelin and colicin
MNMRGRKTWALFAWLGLAAQVAFPQGNPTGTLSGRLSDSGGLALAGVTVTVDSPQLQGTRRTQSSTNGDYIFALLPPGEYTVTFELTGFAAVKQPVRVGAAQAATVDATMKVAALTEEVTVTASAEPFQQDAPVATSFKADLIEKLPTNRTLRDAILLAPNVQSSGPSGAISVAGAMSYESLFLINGVVVNENLRGQPLNLFIEDAVQETTITTAAVSAEFGRFGGGVVNAITKSGGNTFSGSFRTSFFNDDWRSLTPHPNDTRTDDVIPTYEATLGGPIVRDRLWFFGAGRFQNNAVSGNTQITNLPYTVGTEQQRYEGKLTYTLNARHNLRGSFIRVEQDDLNNSFGAIMDMASLYDRKTPQDLLSVNYTGTLASNFFVEAQYSRRQFTFIGSGSRFTDNIQGTLMIDNGRTPATRWWSPTFCGVCDDEKRDNENVLLKAGYFLSTGLGSHNFVAGFDTFDDQRFANNFQSGSSYRVLATRTIVRGADIFPVFDGNTIIRWTPVFESSEGSHFKTHSAFLNDTWRLSERLTFNLGLRYDRNDGTDASGDQVVKDANWSPRVAVTVDPKGDGAWTLSASYGKYVSAIANGVGDTAATGGQPATIDFAYQGPLVNTASPASPVPTDEALRTLFGWFEANGGTGRATRGAPAIPGINLRIGDRLISPNANELTLGVTRKLGARGLVRVDAVYRDFQDFYSQRTDLASGQVSDARLAEFGLRPSGRMFDLRIIENTNRATRTYRGLTGQIAYNVADGVNLGGNYTLSRTNGNFDGEVGTGGPTNASFDFYPEYRQESWNNPEGDLSVDRRHRLRLWTTWDLPAPKGIGDATLSALYHFNSGTPYGAAVNNFDSRSFVTNPGYAAPTANYVYYFTARDAFRTDDEHRFDLSLNWSRRVGVRGLQVFAQGQVLNVLNAQALSNFFYAEPQFGTCGTQGCIDTTVLFNRNDARFAAFNPFTQTPVQGVHWDLGPNFGQSLDRRAYQLPRVYRFSVGVRF